MRWLALALCGAGACTICDHLHTTHGVLVYAHPAIWAQAWWVPLLFAGASVVAVVGAMPVRRLCGGRGGSTPTAREVASDGLFEAGWSALGFFRYHHPDLLGVPRWLPGIYLHVALLGGSLEGVLRGVDA